MINIIRKTDVVVKTTDGKVIEVGDVVYFLASGRICLGKFKGFGKRGAMQFDGVYGLKQYSFAVAPSSICEIYKLGVE